MKKILVIFASIVAVAMAGCSKDTDDDNVVKSLGVSTLAGDKLSRIVLEADNAAYDFKVTASPSKAVLDARDIRIRPKDGGQTQYVNISVKATASNFVIFTVADNGSYKGSGTYEYTLVAEYAPSQAVSQPFVVTKLKKSEQKSFALSLKTVPQTLGVGKSSRLEVSVTPADKELDGDKFKLLTDKNSTPANVTLKYDSCDKGVYAFMLSDKRSSYAAYEETLKVVYDGDEQVATQTFMVKSADQLKVSKVYITLPSGVSRKTDLDDKTSVLYGYRDDGSNFESQYKEDMRVWVDASIRIEAADGFDNLDEMKTQIKGRGNTTWGWSKKPYNLKLEKKSKVLGMNKHKRWCLIANAIDRTHMRNWLAYHVAQQMTFDYSVHDEFVELYFVENGKEDYRGLYLLSEHIKEDKDSRVPLTEVKETQTGVEGDKIGYLLEFDMNYDEPGRFLTNPSRLPVNIKYPAQDDWSAAGNMAQYDTYKSYISEYVNDVDRLICAVGNGTASSDELWTKLDIESMANFWILFETMSCREILWPKSIYFHKEVDQKLKAGPVWDFDYRTLNASDAQSWINYYTGTNSANTTTQYWSKKSNRTWWAQLIKNDKTFRDEIKRQWNAVYPKMTAVYNTQFDAQMALLSEADQRNAQLWNPGDISGNPNSDAYMTFTNAVSTLKNNFKKRIDWLNTQINSW